MSKAQTAIEYLMTYGWAILIILIVAGVLAYYGIFSPKGFEFSRDPEIEKVYINNTSDLCDFIIEKIYGKTEKYICNISD